MGRHYGRVQRNLGIHQKWQDTSWSAKAGWLELFIHAIGTEGMFANLRHVVKLLGMGDCPEPEAIAAELIERRWLDVDDDTGAIAMHDWGDWQATYRGPSDEPEAVAERKRRSRASSGHEEVTTPSRDGTNGHDKASRLGANGVTTDYTLRNSIPSDSIPPTARGAAVSLTAATPRSEEEEGFGTAPDPQRTKRLTDANAALRPKSGATDEERAAARATLREYGVSVPS